MEKSLSIFNIKNLPKGFLLAIILIFAFEIGVSFIPEHKLLTPPYEQTALTIKGELVDRPNSFNIIILGDCLGWAAIKPVDLERILQKSAYSLAVSGGMTYLMSYVLLKRYLSNCVQPPELVILQISANSILYQYGMNPVALNDYILPWFRMDDDFMQELSAPLRRECHRYRMLRFIPSLRNQFFLRTSSWITRMWRPTKAEFERYKIYYQEEKGFYNEDLDPTKKPIEKIYDIGEDFKQFNISDFNVGYMKQIVDLLARYNIKVIICLTPVRDDEMRIWDRYNLRQRLNSTLNELFGSYSNISAIWDMQSVASNPKYYADWRHLNNAGATIFTHELADRIKNLAHRSSDAL